MGTVQFKALLRYFAGSGLAFGAMTLVACNSTPQTNPSVSTASGNTAIRSTAGTNPFGTITSVSPTPTPAPVSTQPVIPALIRGVGYTQTTPITVTVKALNVLKVKWVPLKQDSYIAGTSIQPQYSELSVNVLVGDDQEATIPVAYDPEGLIPNGANPNDPAAASAVIDFSASIPQQVNCDGTDPTCRETVTITILNPQYDYWYFGTSEHEYCYYPNNAPSYCTYYTHVYYTHPWHGMLYIQTDDTEAMPAGTQG